MRIAPLAAALAAQIPFEFRVLDKFRTSYPLMIVGSIEVGMPFLRMLALTRILPLSEVGFCAVLTAFMTFLELSTDIAAYRFVYSTPKAQFEEALAAAHALSVLRGVLLCLLAVCAAPFVAAAVSLGDDWISFAALGPAILLRCLEHLSPRVAERDFHYWPQVKTNAVSFSIALAVLVTVALITRNHEAIIYSIYAQSIAVFFGSRLVSKEPYRLNFKTPLFKSAFKFAYPLMVNGLGLSISQQADRFIVAGLFDLETVAVYSVIVLAATVPMSLLNRILDSMILARLYHANAAPPRLNREIRAASSVVSVLAALYAGAVILLMNPVVTVVFGHKYYAGAWAMMLLGVMTFVRLARMEPFTGVMLNASRTKRLAASNILVSSSLVYMVLLSFFDRTITGVLAARLLGELTSVVATYWMAVRSPEGGRFVFSSSTLIGFVLVGVACLESFALAWSGHSVALLLAGCFAYAIVTLLWGAIDLRHRIGQLRMAVVPETKLETGALPS
jgi:O-antigen/teichoic acid export membrane protein